MWGSVLSQMAARHSSKDVKYVVDSFESTGDVWAGDLEDLPTLRMSEHVVVVKTTQREGAIYELGEEKKRDELKKREDLGQK